MEHRHPFLPLKGRGAAINPDNRFDAWAREAADDGWDHGDGEDEDATTQVKTELIVDTTKTVIARNESPDVPFSQSINPYRGCEHGCIYCFARPSHAYLGFSPGLDFETKIVYKPDAAECLRKELAKPSYICLPIALGINTDAYQPVERKLGLTRSILKVLAETRHPVSLITKSALILRDLDIISAMARDNLVSVAVSITTLNKELARKLEPRAAAPQRRLEVIRALTDAGVAVTVLMAPVIPALTDHEVESLLEATANAGASSAGYVLLRLPHEVSPLFRNWLSHHEPGRAVHVMSLVQQMRGGKDYDSRFGARMRGEGTLADLLEKRFVLARKRFGLDRKRPPLNCSLFTAPRLPTAQLDLFY
jgi:DNA repair photolyase